MSSERPLTLLFSGVDDATMAPEPSVPTDDGDGGGNSRRRAALYIAPFLAVGLLNLGLLLWWGLEPLWAFAILPPILFVSAIGWIAFREGFHERPRESGGRS